MSSKITSLTQLIEELKGATKEEYKSIGVSLEIPLEEILPYAHWSDEHYTRNCIIREDNFELILLCWEPGQGTPVHCHGGEECWVYVVQGKIEESHYQFLNNELVFGDKTTMISGEKSFMSDEMGYHKLENNPLIRTMSLHLYMDPIDDCTIYDKHSGEFVSRSLAYYSYNGILETELA